MVFGSVCVCACDITVVRAPMSCRFNIQDYPSAAVMHRHMIAPQLASSWPLRAAQGRMRRTSSPNSTTSPCQPALANPTSPAAPQDTQPTEAQAADIMTDSQHAALRQPAQPASEEAAAPHSEWARGRTNASITWGRAAILQVDAAEAGLDADDDTPRTPPT